MCNRHSIKTPDCVEWWATQSKLHMTEQMYSNYEQRREPANHRRCAHFSHSPFGSRNRRSNFLLSIICISMFVHTKHPQTHTDTPSGIQSIQQILNIIMLMRFSSVADSDNATRCLHEWNLIEFPTRGNVCKDFRETMCTFARKLYACTKSFSGENPFIPSRTATHCRQSYFSLNGERHAWMVDS